MILLLLRFGLGLSAFLGKATSGKLVPYHTFEEAQHRAHYFLVVRNQENLPFG